jgi:hypothetical protein
MRDDSEHYCRRLSARNTPPSNAASAATRPKPEGDSSVPVTVVVLDSSLAVVVGIIVVVGVVSVVVVVAEGSDLSVPSPWFRSMGRGTVLVVMFIIIHYNYSPVSR